MVLEASIGLIFVFLLFSLVCSASSEVIAWLLSLRASTLRSGIETLLSDASLTELMKQNPKLKSTFDKASSRWKQETQTVASTLYSHPLIQGMIHDRQQPSYIPKHIFAAVFIDMLHSVAGKDATPGDSIQRLRNAISSLPPDSDIRQQMEAVIDDTVKDVQEARTRVERWFDDSMERVSGWYKRKAQIIVLIVATLVVVISNADSVMITQGLARDSALRAGLVAAAEQTTRESAPETRAEPDIQKALTQLQQTQQRINDLRLPIGWTADPQAKIGELPDPRRMPSGWGWLEKIAGLLFTIFAVSMGAPFWFDCLNKVVNARITGGQQPESSSKKEKSRQETED